MLLSFPHEEMKGPIDVLQKCLDVLVARVADGTLQPSPALETVTRTVNQLITRRTELIKERGAAPSTTPTPP
ncbi:hypothetical protein [Polyangium jinanense]|uniref:Uncharacterized protein n=1 Tax=Polyangium jinanense TaxID=2829994 RepID=A0A9X3X7E5_9BACT|nr:hypothetical protein [Polyangium jinanense]MDC3956615.1 hypothetical protein [Polyangium jinanense]MDC3985602.1 hypothetical protein [Polyangium jinanense]